MAEDGLPGFRSVEEARDALLEVIRGGVTTNHVIVRGEPSTPSTEHVRGVYAGQHGAILTEEHGREFDRWLAEHDREARAAASEAIESLRNTLAFSSRDWNTYGDVAWLYGVLLGWDDDDGIDESAMPEVAAQWRWDEANVARLRRLRAALIPYRLNG